jgi:mRNA interferase MazF
MRKPTVIFDRFDVVIVPFPFTDRAQQKRRPALALSSRVFNKAAAHSVMAMITSVGNAPWPLDVRLNNLKSAGLPAASVVRMKLFTLDHQYVLRKVGKLSKADQTNVAQGVAQLFGTNP